MISDPTFYYAAVPAVILAGLSKGGLGGAIGFVAVPLMSLVVSPVQAAGILLPILMVMDLVGIGSYRALADRRTLAIMLPGAVVGILLAWATAALTPEAAIRLLVGALAIGFAISYWLGVGRGRAARQNVAKGTVCGTISGYTSFVSHAGGPPFQVYVMPLGFAPRVYVGTAAWYFFVVNWVKVGPYLALGQFDAENLTTAAVLTPIAIVATWVGTTIPRNVRPQTFYRVLYVCVAVIGAKLIFDGAAAL